MTEMRKVPEWARTSQAEYRECRRELERTCEAAAFEFRAVWNLMITQIEDRHEMFVRGRRKTELTLRQAVADMQDAVIKERAKMEQEKAQAEVPDDPAAVEEYVREMARKDAERVKAAGLT